MQSATNKPDITHLTDSGVKTSGTRLTYIQVHRAAFLGFALDSAQVRSVWKTKVVRFLGLGLSFIMLATPALAAPTEFTSPGFTIGSVIFGGNGTIRLPLSSTPPSISAGPTVTNITTTSAKVNWTADRPTTGFVFVGTTAGTYQFQAFDALSPTLTNHSVDLNFLVKGTKYFYKVQSVDTFGNQVESAEATFVSDSGDITPPVITSGPTVAQSSGSEATVTWTTDELSNSLVEYGIQSVGELTTGRADERSLFHQVVLSSLQGNQTYKFHVRSKDAAGNETISDIGTFTTVASPNITEVKITDVTLNSAVVQWKTSVASSTTVTYGTSSGVYPSKIEDPTLSLTHLVRLTSLINGTIYFVRLSGVDASGTRLSSDEYQVKTVVLPTINDFTVFDIDSQNAKLRWASSAEVDAFVQYEVTASADQTLVGKKQATGDNKLTIDHTLQLSDLQPFTTYAVTIFGNDVFGNRAISPTKSFTTLVDTVPPTFENIQSDTTVDLGSRQTVQVLVSFGLSELASSYIAYGDGAAGDLSKKVEPDKDFSRSKFMVIPDLKPGNSYHFQIHATDRAGNEAVSSDYLVLAPAQPVSLFDLILGQIKVNFGFLAHLGGP